MKEHSHIEQISNRVFRRVEASERKTPRAPAAPLASPTSSRRLIGQRYTVLEHIGRGQLGDIFRALDEASSGHGIDRYVAVQLLDKAYASNPNFIDDLRRRYAALRSGSHPNILELHDFGQHERTAYFVMELLDGATLKYVIRDAAAVPLDETVEIIRPVADALRYLHAKAIVFGNLKPKNVFITFDHTIKLLDVAALPPTVPALNPADDSEAFGRDLPDVRDDVYGLACLSYELLSGRHPFNGNSPLEAQRANLELLPIEGLAQLAWLALAAGLSLTREHRQSTVQRFFDEFTRTKSTEAPRPKVTARPSPAADHGGSTFVPPPKHTEYARPRRAEHPRTARSVQQRSEHQHRFAGGQIIPLTVVGVLAAITFLNYERLARGTTELFSTDAAPEIAAPIADISTAAIEPGEPETDGGLNSTVNSSRVAILAEELRALNAAAETAAESPTTINTTPRAGSISAPPSSPKFLSPAETLARAETPTTENASPASTLTSHNGQPQVELGNNLTPANTAPVAEPLVAGDFLAAGDALPADTTEISGVPIAPIDATSAAATISMPESAGMESLLMPSIGFERTNMVVSESQAAAQIVFTRTGDISAAASFTWWLLDNTALAGDDYADLDRGVESFAPGENSTTIYIPIVSDALPEPTERFHIYVGQRSLEHRQLETLARAQVEIIDDD